MGISGGTQEQNGGRAGRPRAEGVAENAARGNDRAKQFGFEELCGEIRDGHGAPAQKIENARFPKAANPAPGLEQIPEIFRAGLINRQRRDRNNLPKNFGEGLERPGELRVFRGVLFRKARDTRCGFSGVVIKNQRFAIRCGSKNSRIGRKDLAIKLFELHVERNIRAKRTERMRERRSAKAGMKFFGDGAAAHHFAALENERLEAALSQIKGRDQCVVTATDESYALSKRHGQ